MAKKVEDRPVSALKVIEEIGALLGQKGINSTLSAEAVVAAVEDSAMNKDSTVLLASKNNDYPEDPEELELAVSDLTSGTGQSEVEATHSIGNSAITEVAAKKDLRLVYTIVAFTGVIVIGLAIFFGLQVSRPAILVEPVAKEEDRVQLLKPEETISPKQKTNPFDAVVAVAPQEFYFGQNSARQVVVEVNSTQSSTEVFESLLKYDYRPDVSLDDRISAWQF